MRKTQPGGHRASVEAPSFKNTSHAYVHTIRVSRINAEQATAPSRARISAAPSMRVADYVSTGKRWWLRLHENGGKYHDMPAHHMLEEYLDGYIQAPGC